MYLISLSVCQGSLAAVLCFFMFPLLLLLFGELQSFDRSNSVFYAALASTISTTTITRTAAKEADAKTETETVLETQTETQTKLRPRPRTRPRPRLRANPHNNGHTRACFLGTLLGRGGSRKCEILRSGCVID